MMMFEEKLKKMILPKNFNSLIFFVVNENVNRPKPILSMIEGERKNTQKYASLMVT